ncbi:TPA: ABC transporter permease [Streptococcus suis]|uniref:Immunity protein n=1 Tax=Streptococcus suis TaxID=1307 RepID=A0A1D8H043_STRSU|nr:immunity protein [Streptococcus suis]HEL1585326.1 ABC transporter permease [Streptococcus suis]
MVTLIKNEIKRFVGTPTALLLLGITFCLQMLGTVFIIKSLDVQVGDIAQTPFQKSMIIFLGFSGLVSLVVNGITNFFVTSSEHNNHTWELLLLGIGKKNKILFSKYFTVILSFIFYQLLSTIFFVIVTQTYLSLTIDWSTVFLVLSSTIFFSLLTITLQFCAHLLEKNSLSALSSVIILILLQTLFASNAIFIYVFPINGISYLITSSILNPIIILVITLENIIWSGAVLLVVFKKFHL